MKEDEERIEEEEPEIDESLLTPEQKEELAKPFFKWKYLVVWGVLIAAIVACIVVICVLR
jgi:hypothetical protein